MNLQTRLEVQGATQQWVASFMQQYSISASMMEDALNKILCNLKDQVMIEFLSAAAAEQQPPQPLTEEEQHGESMAD